MGDLLNIGASGVRAYQTALTVVGDNIANASSAGYSKRTVNLTEAKSNGAVSVLGLDRTVNGGTLVGGITRAWDSFKAGAVRSASSDVAASETGVTYLTRVEQALSGNGVSKSLTGFFNAAKALAADPTGSAPRTSYLSTAQAVAQSFNATATSLDAVATDLAADTANTVSSLNTLTSQLAKVNLALSTAKAGTSSAASVADQRDQLLDQISSIAPVSVTLNAQGVATVRLNDSNGPVLIDKESAGVVRSDTNASGTTVYTLVRDGGQEQFAANGGALAGLADASARLADARSSLDTVANGFAAAVNANQAQGVDLDGAAGKPMFTTGYTTVAPLPGASGSASISASVAADATPAAGGYTATWDANDQQWTVARSDGSSQVSGNGTLTIDGVTVTLGGAPKEGDGFTIATGNGAAGITATNLAPREVAAAGKWTVDAPITNTGTGSITVSPSGSTALPSLTSYAVGFSDGTVTVTDPSDGTVLATQPYSAGMTIAGAGFTLTLSGQFKNGDSFSIEPTAANSRDNGNLVALEKARNTGGFENRADAIVQSNASALAAKKSLAEAQGAIRDNAISARDEVSGVNLDEEAVSLMRFQQAYQASSRVIQVAREIFQNLLDVV